MGSYKLFFSQILLTSALSLSLGTSLKAGVEGDDGQGNRLAVSKYTPIPDEDEPKKRSDPDKDEPKHTSFIADRELATELQLHILSFLDPAKEKDLKALLNFRGVSKKSKALVDTVLEIVPSTLHPMDSHITDPIRMRVIPKLLSRACAQIKSPFYDIQKKGVQKLEALADTGSRRAAYKLLIRLAQTPKLMDEVRYTVDGLHLLYKDVMCLTNRFKDTSEQGQDEEGDIEKKPCEEKHIEKKQVPVKKKPSLMKKMKFKREKKEKKIETPPSNAGSYNDYCEAENRVGMERPHWLFPNYCSEEINQGLLKLPYWMHELAQAAPTKFKHAQEYEARTSLYRMYISDQGKRAPVKQRFFMAKSIMADAFKDESHQNSNIAIRKALAELRDLDFLPELPHQDREYMKVRTEVHFLRIQGCDLIRERAPVFNKKVGHSWYKEVAAQGLGGAYYALKCLGDTHFIHEIQYTLHGLAQYEGAESYLKRKHYEDARHWYQQALKSGHPKAEKELKRVEKILAKKAKK